MALTRLARFAPLLVWGALIVCVAFSAITICHDGKRYPCADDWDEVPALTGATPITLSYLWSQHNEHRIFVPRLIMLTTLRLSHADYRAPVLFDLAALGLLAAAMILTARKLRGRTRYADALFALLLLLPLQGGLLWSFQVQFVSSSLTLGALLLVAARGERPLSPACAAVAGGGLIVAPLCGANGLVMVPPIAAWLIVRAVTQLRAAEPKAKRGGLVLATLTAAALALSLFYFHGYDQPTDHDWPHAGVAQTTLVSVRALASGLGYWAAQLYWPWTGIAVTALVLASAILLARRWRADPAERPRILGLLALLAAVVCVAVGVGWGRAGRGWEPGLESHYSSSELLPLCVVYFVWEIYGPRSASRVLLPTLCLAVAIVCGQAAFVRAQWSEHPAPERVQLEGDLRRDMTAEELVARNILPLHGADTPGAREQVVAGVRLLREARMGVFDHVR